MGYRSLIKGFVATAFKTIGDLKDTVEYHHVIAGTVDPDTDEQMLDTDDPETFECAKVKLTDEEVDYFPGPLITERLLIPWNVISLVPAEADYVIIAGIRWEVRRFKGVPGESLWIVYIQRN